MHMKKIITLLMALCMVTTLFTACSSNKEPAPEPIPEPEPEIEVPEVFLNPLTGLPVEEDISALRPYAVMINNIKKANPQVGISAADIIYEVCVEGGITRMMALYQDFADTDVVGSIRSARHYFIELAEPYDSIFIHAGGSKQAYSAISENKTDNIDGVNGKSEVFYRDAQRKSKMGYEHSMMLSTEKVASHLETKNIRALHDDGFEINMTFAEDAAPLNGLAANSIDVYFGGSKHTIFEYNADEKVYYANQYGKAYTDGGNDTQVSVSNVLVLFAPTSLIPGDTAGRLNIDLTGSGEGYFACGGKYIKILWEKSGPSSQFEYKLEDGTKLVFNAGKTYINVVPTGNSIKFA